MLWLLLSLVQARSLPVQSHLEVVFEDVPEKKARLKLIRKAFRTAPTLTGGKDWGRVMCFVFTGGTDAAGLEKAMAKSRLTGTIREADTCSEPPVEAYIPPEAEAHRRITFFEPTEPLLARKALAYLLDGDFGVSGLQLARERSSHACLELDREVLDVELEALLATSPIRVVDIAPAANCGEALQAE